MEEEEELDDGGGGGGGGAETTTGGAVPADGGQPERVRSEAEEVEIFPRGKERSGETAGAVGDATDVEDRGDTPKRQRDPTMKDDQRNCLRDRPWKVVGLKNFVI